MNFSNLKKLIWNKYFLSSSFLIYSYFVNRQCRKSQELIYRNPNPLKKSEMSKRTSQISDLNYKLFLNLKKDKEYFEGYVKIDFCLTDVEGLFLDYLGEVESLSINNDHKYSHYKYDHNRIHLNPRSLKKGENSIIYTNLDPHNAHLVFPCFDQPDLKSNLELFTYTHKDLTILSNSESEIETSKENLFFELKNDSEYKLTKFKLIKHISPYQFILIGGVFNLIKDSTNLDRPNLNIYSKKSLEDKTRINPTEIFALIRESIIWFSDRFDSPFPFDKLDLVFISDYQNVANSCPGGLIVIDDRFLQKSTDSIDLNYFNLILITQISQMWLSHYISRKSWEDSFFYESINLFLTSLFFKEKCQTNKNVKEENQLIWIMFDFFKSKGILADKSFDPHNIILDIEDSEEAEILCDDEITIYKSSAIMKYFYYLNPNKFWLVVKNFITCYSSQSSNKLAGYRGFIDMYEMLEDQNVCNEDDKKFLATHQYKYYLSNEKISRLSIRLPKIKENEEFNKIVIIQEFPTLFLNPINSEDNINEDIYYPFVIDILLKYSDREEIIKGIKIKPKKINVITLPKNYKKPQCIILNPSDIAYMTQKFDDSTINYLLENTGEIHSESTRLLIVRDLYELIKDGDYDPILYIKFCENLLTRENNIYIINKLISLTISVINNYIPQSAKMTQKQSFFKLLSEKYFSHPLYEKYLKKNMVNYLLDLINTKNLDSLQYFLISNLEISLEKSHNETLNNLDEDSEIYELPYLDKMTKKRIVESVYESDKFTFFEKIDLKNKILNESNKLIDLTLQTCHLDKNDHSIRKSLWNLFVYRDFSYSDQEIKAMMKGFNRGNVKLNSVRDDNLIIYFKKRFFKDLPYVSSTFSQNYAIQFYKYLFPNHLIEEKILKKLLRLKSSINFEYHPNPKLKYLIENDILKLKHKLLVVKCNSSLLYNSMSFRKI